MERTRTFIADASDSTSERRIARHCIWFAVGIFDPSVWCSVRRIDIRDTGAGLPPACEFVRRNGSIRSLVSDLQVQGKEIIGNGRCS